jgi:hypothetical protein
MAISVAVFLPIAVSAPNAWGIATIVAFVIGFSVFVSAKVPMLGKAQWWFIGPQSMPRPLRTRYWTGYAVMGVAVLMTVVLAASLGVR